MESEMRIAPSAQGELQCCYWTQDFALRVSASCFVLSQSSSEAVPGVYFSWDYSHSGIWMSAGKTEDFLCIRDISVFLVTLQGFYCKLLLWFPVAVRVHQFGTCFL